MFRLADIAMLAMERSDRLMVTAEKLALDSGDAVSCRKGCAACCRELIPVSPAEAFFLKELLGSLPPSLRTSAEGGFHRSRLVLAEARTEGIPFPDEAAYFRLQLPCPFLADEGCTIHPRRPLACREHLVVSEAGHCGAFPSFFIRPLPLAGRVGDSLYALCSELLGRPPERIPLVSALVWAEEHAGDGLLEWEEERILSALDFHVRRNGG